MNLGNLNLQQLAQQIPAILAIITAVIGGIGGVAPQLSSLSSAPGPVVPGPSDPGGTPGQNVNGVVRVTDQYGIRGTHRVGAATINGVQYPDSLIVRNGSSEGRTHRIDISQYDGFSGRVGFIDGSESNQYATAQVLIDDAVVWEQRVNHGDLKHFNLEVTNNRKAEIRVTTFQASSNQKWEYGGFAWASPQMYKD